jgi:hypothetical protein
VHPGASRSRRGSSSCSDRRVVPGPRPWVTPATEDVVELTVE